MKILSVSDRIEPFLYSEQAPAQYQGVSLILACGDLPPEYLTYLRNVFQVPLFYVAGNHDLRYVQSPPTACINLHARFEKYKGLKMLGLEGSRWYNGGRYQYTEAQMRRIIFRLWPTLWWTKPLDIIVTHAPPRFIQDAEDLCHRGFKSYRRLIDRFSPRFFIHGHIHADFEDYSQRMTIVNQTKVINSYGHVLFEIDPEG
jgi:Icc-related predicted phosphoesterase